MLKAISREQYLSPVNGTIIRSLALRPISEVVIDITQSKSVSSAIAHGIVDAIKVPLQYLAPQTTRAYVEFKRDLPSYTSRLSAQDQQKLAESVLNNRGARYDRIGLGLDVVSFLGGIILGTALASHGHAEGLNSLPDFILGKLVGNVVTDGVGSFVRARGNKNKS